MSQPTGPAPLLPSPHPRNKMVLVVLAAVALATLLLSVIAMKVATGGGNNSEAEPSPAATSLTAPTITATRALALVAPTAPAGRCAAPTAEMLSTQSVAFEGTVTDLTDAEARLEVSRWYAGCGQDAASSLEPSSEPSPEIGAVPSTVSVSVPAAGSAALHELLVGVDFAVGERFLVSAVDDHVSLCGLSGPWSPELESLYVEAFPAPTG